MPDRVRLRDSLIPETARLIRDQQSLRWGLTLRRATAATIAKRFSALALGRRAGMSALTESLGR